MKDLILNSFEPAKKITPTLDLYEQFQSSQKEYISLPKFCVLMDKNFRHLGGIDKTLADHNNVGYKLEFVGKPIKTKKTKKTDDPNAGDEDNNNDE